MYNLALQEHDGSHWRQTSAYEPGYRYDNWSSNLYPATWYISHRECPATTCGRQRLCIPNKRNCTIIIISVQRGITWNQILLYRRQEERNRLSRTRKKTPTGPRTAHTNGRMAFTRDAELSSNNDFVRLSLLHQA